MKKINAYFTAGTLGTILTAVLQIFTTLFVSAAIFQIIFYLLYPVFIIMLIVGYRKILKEKNLA